MIGDYAVSLGFAILNVRLFGRLNAVQELINHETFEEEFTKLVKGLPDLECIVSRIHAINCKVKDFVKVLLYAIPLILQFYCVDMKYAPGI